MSEATISHSYRYTILRYWIDVDRDMSVPIGIALSTSEGRYLRFRLPNEVERIHDVPDSAKPVIKFICAKIDNWMRTETLPYAKEPMEPLSDVWWAHVRKLLQFRIRIGNVIAIDCQRPTEEIETLYESIVKPQVSSQIKAERIDGAVSRALGKLVNRFEYGKAVPGYGDRPVQVLRHAEGQDRLVVVEAVNLAASTAERDSDAMTSKLMRIQAANPNTSIVMGYLASPHGLNGEGALKSWIEDSLKIEIYDLTLESDKFRDRANNALQTIAHGLGGLAE